MYPELTLPLVISVAAAATAVIGLVTRGPVLRRLALRQVARRPIEAVLVIGGSILGTALIVSSLSVGDSLDRSIREVAVDVLGPIDERVTTTDPERGAAIGAALAPLADDPDVDGVLTVRHTVAASAVEDPAGRRAEPITWVWDLDFGQAGVFGGERSGLTGPPPPPGEAVVNDELAARLRIGPGDELTLYLFGRSVDLRVSRVVAHQGLGGMGLGASENPAVFLPPGRLTELAVEGGSEDRPQTSTLVSNRGGTMSGAALTDVVSAAIVDTLERAGEPATVLSVKQEVIDEADETSGVMGSLFLFIGSFSIIAGALLLMNVFVMLSEERKAQLGMLRAMGLTRRRLVGEFAVEGAVYALIAGILGVLVGVVVGRGVVVLAEQVLNQWDYGDQRLDLSFQVSATSLINGFAAGFLISFGTVVLTSIRLSRLNIIAAIRDLNDGDSRTVRPRWILLSSLATIVFVAASVPAVASSSGVGTYLLPSLAAVSAAPLLRRRFDGRRTWTLVSGAVLVWALVANLVRPAVFDTPSMAVYIVLGVLVTFSAVVVVSENQDVVLRPIRWLVERGGEVGLTIRLAVAYPTARRFRTGATLVMYSIVVFVVVLLTQISAILDASVGNAVDDAAAGWTHRVDINAPDIGASGANPLSSGALGRRIEEAAPLMIAPARAGDGDDDSAVVVVGMPPDTATTHVLALDERLPAYADDVAVWRAVLANPDYVVIDAFFGSGGGPQGRTIEPGDSLTLVDPETGVRHAKTIAGIMAGASAFYGIGPGEFRYPVLMGVEGATAFSGARTSAYLVAAADGPGRDTFSADVQGELLASGVVAVDIAERVQNDFAASRSFFRLMQGFLALGLLVGITGLGVVMVRAVRERRRTIGVLRALGFQAGSIRRSFMAESTMIAVEGIVLGAVLAVVTTWLLYQNSAAFQGLDASYPIAWRDIAVVVGATLVASLAATLGPAHRAARVRPAIAVRVAD